MIINILNKRNKSELEGKDTDYVGRPSPLGNPFTAKQEGSRDKAVEKYRFWLNIQWKSGNPQVVNEINRLKEKLKTNGELNLVCWCSPAKCHAEIISTAVMNLVNREKRQCQDSQS